MTDTEEMLIKQYGVLLSFKALAELFNRSEDGLRVSLCRDDPLSQKLKAARAGKNGKLGRRVMFKSAAIAKIIDEA